MSDRVNGHAGGPRRLRARRWVLRWRRRSALGDDGRMSLVDHLRELRARLVKALLGVALAAVAAWFFYDELFDLLRSPFEDYAATARARGVPEPQLVLRGVTDAFFLQLKVSVAAAVVLASPVWIYQAWAFVTPGLHRHERRWSLAFLAAAVPLFLTGVAAAFVILPFGLRILFGFTPEGVQNIPDVNVYLNFFIRMVLVFGVGFLLPVFIVMLSATGALPWARLKRWTRGLVFGVFVFSAVATPTGDPLTMLVLAIPLLVLLAAGMAVARAIDVRRRRHATEPDYASLDDDEASPIDPAPAGWDRDESLPR